MCLHTRFKYLSHWQAANTQTSMPYEHKIVIIFLPINLNMCFGCSKELSDGDGSFEYPQEMFWMRNKENNFQYALLSGGLACAYASLERVFPFCRHKVRKLRKAQTKNSKTSRPA